MSDNQSSTGPAHHPGTRKGEELGFKGESGHDDKGTSHANRPAGTRTARSATSINPDKEEPISPDTPSMPPD